MRPLTLNFRLNISSCRSHTGNPLCRHSYISLHCEWHLNLCWRCSATYWIKRRLFHFIIVMHMGLIYTLLHDSPNEVVGLTKWAVREPQVRLCESRCVWPLTFDLDLWTLTLKRASRLNRALRDHIARFATVSPPDLAPRDRARFARPSLFVQPRPPTKPPSSDRLRARKVLRS